MRLTALLLTVLTVSVARNAPTQDICGLWVADLTKCDRGTGPQPTRLILNVTRDGTRLKVIEVTSDEVGSYVVFRFSVKWRGSAPPLVSVPPLRGGDFQGIRVYRSDVFWGRARKSGFRAQHRLD